MKPCEVCGGYCIDADTCYWSVLIGKPYDWRGFPTGRKVKPFEEDSA